MNYTWFVLTGLMQWVYRYHKFGNISFVASAQMMGIDVDALGFFCFSWYFTMHEMLYFGLATGSGLK